MPKIERKYGTKKLSFGPLKLGFLKLNRDLCKTAVVQGGMDDLIAQEPIVVQSLVAGGMTEADAKRAAEGLDVPDLYDAVKASMEASGFVYGPAKSGEADPAKA